MDDLKSIINLINFFPHVNNKSAVDNLKQKIIKKSFNKKQFWTIIISTFATKFQRFSASGTSKCVAYGKGFNFMVKTNPIAKWTLIAQTGELEVWFLSTFWFNNEYCIVNIVIPGPVIISRDKDLQKL